MYEKITVFMMFMIIISMSVCCISNYGYCGSVRFSGYYRITAKHSGKCLDVNGASSESGATIIQYSCHGKDNQLFTLVPKGDGYYSIVAKNSGKCLDVNGASQDTAYVIQYSCHGKDNQLWRIE
jgi:aspartate 1-decarboxylase